MSASIAARNIAGVVLLGLGLAVGSTGAPAVAATTVHTGVATQLGPCPTPTEAPGTEPIPFPLTSSVKPTDTSTSTVIVPDGPQMQCSTTAPTLYEDITYSSPTTGGVETDLKLDLQIPDTPGDKPLVIYITGGGFITADKSANLGQRTYVADQGYAVASIEYRTQLTGATYEDGLADVKSAVRYLRAHADEYGIDASQVAVWGQSAGGYLAAMAGATNGIKRFDIGENLNQSSSVQAVVDEFGASDLAGMADDYDAATQTAYMAPGSFINNYVFGPGSTRTVATDARANRAANPATYLRRGVSAPVVMLHGDQDQIVSPSQTLTYLNALKAKGVEGTRYVVQGANHGDMSFLGDPDAGLLWSTQKVMDVITGFLDQKIGS
ncbi:alpha/beta hydrolase [Streptomyces sp. NPDC093252]|uniref:alpha/beta hydrolase n=1 Tax=Streptomyces sp. NPDC093252 TaxID=3154980 RepID=UPI0034216CD4